MPVIVVALAPKTCAKMPSSASRVRASSASCTFAYVPTVMRRAERSDDKLEDMKVPSHERVRSCRPQHTGRRAVRQKKRRRRSVIDAASEWNDANGSSSGCVAVLVFVVGLDVSAVVAAALGADAVEDDAEVFGLELPQAVTHALEQATAVAAGADDAD